MFKRLYNKDFRLLRHICLLEDCDEEAGSISYFLHKLGRVLKLMVTTTPAERDRSALAALADGGEWEKRADAIEKARAELELELRDHA